jgi:hypothetical protein
MMAQGGQMDRQRQMQMYGMQGTVQALQSRGYSNADILAIIANPEAGKAAFGGIYGPDTHSVVDINNPNSPTGHTSAVIGSKSGVVSAAAPIPPQAVQFLHQNLSNPQAVQDFDGKYGQGMAMKVLGQR